MRNVRSAMFLGCLAAACGPATSDDTTATEPASTDDPATSAAQPTTGPDATTDAPPDPTTTADPTTADPTTADPTTADPTTDAPPTCPEGQPGETPRWDHVFPDIESGPRVGGVVVTPDGTVVVSHRQVTPDGDIVGASFFTQDGVLVSQGNFNTGLSIFSARIEQVGARTVLFGTRFGPEDAPDIGWFGEIAQDSGAFKLTDIADPTMNRPFALVDAGGSTLVGAIDFDSHALLVGGLDLDTGALAWTLSMPGEALATDMAAGPNGEVVLVRGKWGDDLPSELRAWRLGGAGQILWESSFTPKDPGSGQFAGAAVTADGQVVVLEQWFEPGRLFATGLDLAEGASLWRTQIAADTPDNLVRAGGVIADPGGVRVVLGATNDSATAPTVGAIVALSLAGDLVDARPLALPELLGGNLLMPARGACGELYLLHPGSPGWLGAFGP